MPRGPLPAWARVRAVLLDVDDTLIDTRAAMHQAGTVASGVVWPAADRSRIALAGERFRSDPDGFFGAYTRGESTFAAMRRARIGALATWLGQELGEGHAGAWLAAYEPAFEAALRAHTDAELALTRLAAHGIPVGFLTNSGADYTARKLALTGLGGLVDVICTRDTLGFGKPDPRAFHEACRRLGTAPAETLYVGDELLSDALGAADAGMPAGWLVRDGAPDPGEADVVAGRGIPVLANLIQVADGLGCP